MFEMQLYKKWSEIDLEDADLKTELEKIKGDDQAIIDRFYQELSFGTGGLRGVIGAGTNRMNIYTVRKATQGLADFLKDKYQNSSAAISFDSRIKSDLFAKEAACVLAANGIQVYIMKEMMPTPVLSYAVRSLNCQAGIMVTASHNPAKYNGYKAYGSDGCQMNLNDSEKIIEYSSKVDIFEGVRKIPFEEGVSKGLIRFIDGNLIAGFLDCVEAQQIQKGICEASGLSVVYTPLNGTGNKPVRAILDRIGVRKVTVVAQQEYADGNFPTCPYPNPEIKEALALGLELCKTVQPDLLLATDPDCDRVGIAIRLNNGEYQLMSGNDVGAMLLYYIASQKSKNGTMPKNPITVKTIVTTDLALAIAEDFGVEMINVLTGFKFIGEQITALEEKGQEGRYIFGFEESYGYLAGTHVRDKDAVVASMLICEMAAFYKTKGMTLVDMLNMLYEKYGTYYHTQDNFTFEGAQGMHKMVEIMDDFRQNRPKGFAGLACIKFSDYEKSIEVDIVNNTTGEILLPQSNVLCFTLEDKCSVVIRPSGTEPKIKFYYTTKSDSLDKAVELCRQMSNEVKLRLGV